MTHWQNAPSFDPLINYTIVLEPQVVLNFEARRAENGGL